jgi:hypothetical protein
MKTSNITTFCVEPNTAKDHQTQMSGFEHEINSFSSCLLPPEENNKKQREKCLVSYERDCNIISY